MDKELTKHEKEIYNKIKLYESQIKAAKGKAQIDKINGQIKDLSDYHHMIVGNFQHERLVHLIITLFFGSLLIFAATAMFLLGQSQDMYNNTLINYPIMIICAILFIVEIFYVLYYYKLENGCQRLYLLSNKLFLLNHNE